MKLEEEEEVEGVVAGSERLTSVDLRVNVLLRLPSPLEVVKLACLSKSWGDVVRDYSCLYMKRLRDSSPGVVIATQPCRRLSGRVELSYLLPCGRLRSLMTFDYCPTPTNAAMLSYSINGLLLFRNRVEFILCNPITRECRTLPRPPVYCPEYGAAVGFGYSPSTDEYKVVTIWQECRRPPQSWSWECKVMTLSDGTWRTVEYAIGHIPCPSTSICLDGAIYFSNVEGKAMVISFDVRDETFRMFRGPPKECDNDVFRTFSLLRGRLCLATSLLGYGYEAGWDAVWVWMMVSEGEWVRHLKFELEVLRPHLKAFFSDRPVDIYWIAEDRLFICRRTRIRYCEAIIFDLKTQTKVGETVPLDDIIIIGQSAIQESLLPLR